MTMRLPPGAALAAALFFCTATPALAEETPVNEFRNAGGALVCNSGAKSASYNACLRVGPVHIGQDLREISRMFGKANRVVEERGATMRVYVIRAGAAAGQRIPYWVIGFRERKVVSIQLTGQLTGQSTGPRGGGQFAFSSIRIGDPASKVTATLGPPAVKRLVADVSATYWGYDPLPIALEIMDGRVYSIRVSEPPGG